MLAAGDAPTIYSQHDTAGDCIGAAIMAENDGYRLATCAPTNGDAFVELAAAMAHEAGLLIVKDY